MEASDLSEMENSVEKKRKNRQIDSSSLYILKNKKGKKLQLGKNSRCVDKKSVTKSKITIPQYESSSASKSSISDIGKLMFIL